MFLKKLNENNTFFLVSLVSLEQNISVYTVFFIFNETFYETSMKPMKLFYETNETLWFHKKFHSQGIENTKLNLVF